MNINRMLVAPGESHTTEERRIEEKMADGIRHLKRLTVQLDEELYGCEWEEARLTAQKIAAHTQYMGKLNIRLTDVQGINAQFARIQTHIDRIEAALLDHGVPTT
jgi:hypothetical protein